MRHTHLAIFLIICLLALILPSCSQRRERVLHETGMVIEKQYHAEKNQKGTSSSVGSSTYDSHTTFSSHEVHEEEKYLVVFKCEHNTCFSINNPSVYSKLERGDTVTISYYEWVNDAGKVVDLEFIDADKRTATTKNTNPNW
jgi:hypothetical protein